MHPRQWRYTYRPTLNNWNNKNCKFQSSWFYYSILIFSFHYIKVRIQLKRGLVSILLDSLFEILWMVTDQEFQQTGRYRFYFPSFYISDTYCGVHPNISVIYLDSFCPQVLKSILKIPTIFGPHGCWSWEVINSYLRRLKKIFLPYLKFDLVKYIY